MADALRVKEFDDIVFEHRNREYGAFELRKRYPRTMNIAFLIAMSVFVLAVCTPMILSYISDLSGPEQALTKETEVTLEDLPEEKDDIKPPEPPPEPPPPVQETIKFTPPEIVEEAKAEDIPPPADAIQKAEVSDKTQEGSDTLLTIPDQKPNVTGPDPNQVFTVVEQMPEFPGGDTKMREYLKKNIKYPPIAHENRITGTVYVSFVVESNGQITDVKALRGLGGGCTEEALRVVKQMPAWNAGRQNDRPVRVQFTLPINFVLRQ